MKKYRVTVELITVITVNCENRDEAKRLATAEASLLPNVVSKQILSVVRENHKCDQSKASDFYFDAKHFKKASKAAAYAAKLSKKCCNLSPDTDWIVIEA